MIKKKSILLFVLFFISTILFSIQLLAEEIGKDVTITYFGQSAFKFISPKNVIIYIDPFLSKNPRTPPEMKEVEKADIVLVTHGHFDHVGDTILISQKTNAKVISIYELGSYLTKKGAKNVVGMNKGGTYKSHGISFIMVPATHSSGVIEGDNIFYGGEAIGFVIRFENGFTIYHAGDTGVFSDMKIIGELYKPELSLLPIGSHYTMGPMEAAYAAKLLGSKYVIPMHYGTSPALTGTVEEFLNWMKEVPGTRVLVLKPGETIK
jgi:L-ascorbate metabolism protein UlaG (beta-lactamase superfamily)